MKSQVEEVIKLNRIQLNSDLKKLEDGKIITHDEYKQIHDRLNADLDYYLKNQDIDFPGLEKMFFETIKSFENIKITQPIFLLMISNFHTITSQITMRQFPINQQDYAIQSKLNKVMNAWFDNYQNDSEKIADLITQINKEKEWNGYKDISASEYDEIISTITHIKNDSTISANELKKTLIDGMLKYCNGSVNSNLVILNIYKTVDRIKKLGLNDELSAIFNRNKIQPKELSYSEIKEQVTAQFKMLLAEKMITQPEFENYTQTIIQDVQFCEKNTDTTQIKTQLLSSLKKLKFAELDTEDREAITYWYFILSQKTKVDIKTDLNEWLYDFDTN